MVERVKSCWNEDMFWIIGIRLLWSMHAMHGGISSIRFGTRYGCGDRFMVGMHAMHG